MSVLKIIQVPDKLLRQESKAVKKLDSKTKKMISDMWETLEAQEDPEGVGLAAAQVGVLLKIFILHYKKTKRTVINPRVIARSSVEKNTKIDKKSERPLEGCLSLPHYYGPIKRPEKIKIEYQTPGTANYELSTKSEEFRGFLAHIVSHEIDHLEGKIFIDKVLEQKAPLYKFDGEEWEEVELVI